jgi:hypothetical protein
LFFCGVCLVFAGAVWQPIARPTPLQAFRRHQKTDAAG